MKNISKLRKNSFVCYIFIAVGAILCAAALNLFFVPNSIAPGGFSGIATILYKLSKGRLPIGITMMLLNLPLFVIAIRRLGRTFALKTLYALILFSVLTDVIPAYAVTSDKVLAAVYGGAIMGAGLGIIIFFGACTGGTDLLATIINSVIHTMSTSALLFVIDSLVILASVFVFGMQSALLAAASVYITSKIIEILTESSSAGRAYMIVSQRNAQIKKRIQDEMKRGVTEIYSKGGFTGNDMPVLMCAVDRRSESVMLKKIIEEEDNNAFFIALSANEIRGEGFSD
ncbi:MAG: YitT family protein [Christensenellaceae bacterium]|nr:YitT family protein [Christensenellaceae bacterium]